MSDTPSPETPPTPVPDNTSPAPASAAPPAAPAAVPGSKGGDPASADRVHAAIEKARLEERTKLRGQIETAEARIRELENTVRELEARQQQTPTQTPSTENPNVNDEMTRRLQTLESELTRLNGQLLRERTINDELKNGGKFIPEMLTADTEAELRQQLEASRAAYARVMANQPQTPPTPAPAAPPAAPTNPDVTPPTPVSPPPANPANPLASLRTAIPAPNGLLDRNWRQQWAEKREQILRQVSPGAPKNPITGT